MPFHGGKKLYFKGSWNLYNQEGINLKAEVQAIFSKHGTFKHGTVYVGNKRSCCAESVQIPQSAEVFDLCYLENILNMLRQVKHFT